MRRFYLPSVPLILVLIGVVGCTDERSALQGDGATGTPNAAVCAAVPDGAAEVISLTPAAAAQLRLVMEQNDLSETDYLRVLVTQGGCQGYLYDMRFVTEVEPQSDVVLLSHGVNVVVDKKSLLFLSGTTIDFYDGVEKRGFTFENPNAVTFSGDQSS
ncbi:HesB/IscA family protein [Posidoniimonas corsicana]|nr:iron-sulfur cluster assembly accessory protein [Posidoniimonas corsicana]